MTDYRLIIDGKPLETRETFAVFNPSTGAEAGRAPNAGPAELDVAVAAAKRAFPGWSGRDDATLREACVTATAKLQENAEELAHILTLEGTVKLLAKSRTSPPPEKSARLARPRSLANNFTVPSTC